MAIEPATDDDRQCSGSSGRELTLFVAARGFDGRARIRATAPPGLQWYRAHTTAARCTASSYQQYHLAPPGHNWRRPGHGTIVVYFHLGSEAMMRPLHNQIRGFAQDDVRDAQRPSSSDVGTGSVHYLESRPSARHSVVEYGTDHRSTCPEGWPVVDADVPRSLMSHTTFSGLVRPVEEGHPWLYYSIAEARSFERECDQAPSPSMQEDARSWQPMIERAQDVARSVEYMAPPASGECARLAREFDALLTAFPADPSVTVRWESIGYEHLNRMNAYRDVLAALASGRERDISSPIDSA